MKRATCNPDKCTKCMHLGMRFTYDKKTSKVGYIRHCYNFKKDLLELHGGRTVACEECNIPVYITKSWYEDCIMRDIHKSLDRIEDKLEKLNEIL